MQRGYYVLTSRDISYSQQIKILKVLLFLAPSDRRFAYKRLFSLWDKNMTDEIAECWKQFHDNDCANLITRLLPLEFIRENIESLSLPRNYYTLCRRLGNEPWFKPRKELFPDDITVRYYLEAMAYTQYPISNAEAREILFMMVSVAMHSILLNESADGMDEREWLFRLDDRIQHNMSEWFDIRNCSFMNMYCLGIILSLLCKMGCYEAVEEFTRWNNSLADHYARLKTLMPYYSYYSPGAYFINVLSVAWYLFPKDLSYMLDYSSYICGTRLNKNWDILLHVVPRKLIKKLPVTLENSLRKLSNDDFDVERLRENMALDSNSIIAYNNTEFYVCKEEARRVILANPALLFPSDCENLIHGLEDDPFSPESPTTQNDIPDFLGVP